MLGLNSSDWHHLCHWLYQKVLVYIVTCSSLEARPCTDGSWFFCPSCFQPGHMFRLGVMSAAYFWPRHSNLFITFHSHSPLRTCKVCRGRSSFAHISVRVGRTCRSLRFVMPFCSLVNPNPFLKAPNNVTVTLFFFPNQDCTIADPAWAQSTFLQFVRLQAGAG